MGQVFDGVNLEDLVEGNLSSESVTQEEVNAEGTQTPEALKEINFDLNEISSLTNEKEIDQETDTDEEINKTPEEKPKGSPSSQNSMLIPLTSALVESGVLSSLEEDDIKGIVDTDTLMAAVAKQIKTNELKDLNEEQKIYLEALRNGVPTEEYATQKSNAEQYKKLTDDVISKNEKLQHELIRRDFLLKGFDEQKATKFANLAMEDENAYEEALLAKNSLVAHEEGILNTQISEAVAKKQALIDKEVKDIEDLKSKITETSDLIPGIKFNSSFKDKTFASMTTPVKVDDKSGPLNEVMLSYKNDPEYKLKLHALHVATKGFTDFSKFASTTKSKAVQELKDKLESNSTAGLPLHVTTSSTQKGLSKALADLNL